MTLALRTLLLVLLALWLAVPSSAASAEDRSVVATERVRAELMAHAPDGVGPGRTVWVGVQLEHQRGWHSYWKNSGDSGLPTQLQWTLPAGVAAGDIAWPIPSKIPFGTLTNYGYGERYCFRCR
jgi:DsbC/DsbD-like thiol-disulfide interchange protein